MEKTCKVITNPSVARELLRRKFTIVDIKPNKFLANASVFVFKLEPGLMAAVRKYKEERKNKKAN